MASKRRAREDPCAICSHYHDYEGGEPCSICGHVLVSTSQKAGDTVMPTAILPGHLYLGSYDTASRSELLKAMGITHILNTVPACQALFKNTFSYLTVSESPPQFEQCHEFIETVKSPDDRILVYCMSGTSRSPSVVISYLMRKRGWRLAESYKWVKDKRPSIKISPEETKRLVEYELLLFGNCSAPLGLAALDNTNHGLSFANHEQHVSAQPQAQPAQPAQQSAFPVFGAQQWSMSAQQAPGALVFGAHAPAATNNAAEQSGMEM
eukprot:CAMPEP_0119115546 /NCGR_PEP_ID=MMETSP1180-20130426/51327_1 /TAXON_ID=3052 ORGANISM="Chlamydomonas cf sp, Strain CCMP681" /NCGR_SAMPLE_ID=MMETSP1180 /ASSEMBLY_ACC=CAM_ASM_000741 /LENGTH=265 /DNA_ID=CAMNT_0007104579 /DNA_START=24 /DNA_END=821 /DNA_ORIENTATION=-